MQHTAVHDQILVVAGTCKRQRFQGSDLRPYWSSLRKLAWLGNAYVETSLARSCHQWSRDAHLGWFAVFLLHNVTAAGPDLISATMQLGWSEINLSCIVLQNPFLALMLRIIMIGCPIVKVNLRGEGLEDLMSREIQQGRDFQTTYRWRSEIPCLQSTHPERKREDVEMSTKKKKTRFGFQSGMYPL